jgi:hypothetical protein
MEKKKFGLNSSLVETSCVEMGWCGLELVSTRDELH